MSVPQSNIVQGTAMQSNTPLPPKQPSTPQPNPADIVEIKIRMPRAYYDAFSNFAQFLHKQQAQDPNTGKLLFDETTKQPIMNLPRPDVQTYMMTCAVQTYQVYQMVAQQAKVRNDQINAQKQQAQAQAQQPR